MGMRFNISPIQVVGYPNVKMVSINGLKATQSIEVKSMLYEMKKIKPDLIIEIGTCSGGFSLLLRKYFNCDIHTFDNEEWKPIKLKRDLFQENKITFHKEDCWSSKKLSVLLKDDRKKVVFCDGGNKADEFNTFLHEINVGDLIGVHDYFEKIEYRDDNIWTTCEVNKSMLDLRGMKEYNKEVCSRSVWGVFEKETLVKRVVIKPTNIPIEQMYFRVKRYAKS
jgi:hypothetical protein